MTRPSDYRPEMPGTTITDAEVESLLSRRGSADPGLADLADLIDSIHLSRLDIDLEDRFGRYSLRAATFSRSVQPPAKRTWFTRIRPGFAGIGLATILLMTTTGAALAADASAPGDLLYGLDRAVERIGLNDGGIQERLQEAEILSERGETSAALDHVADALPESANLAANALHRAVENLGGDSVDSGIAGRVGAMLDWMASTDVEGRDFGQGVAERARELGNQDLAPSSTKSGEGRSGNGNSRANGNGRPDGTAPGQSGR